MIVYVVSFDGHPEAGGVSGIDWYLVAQAAEERYQECLSDDETYGSDTVSLFTAVLPDSLDTARDNAKITDLIDAYVWDNGPIPHLSTQEIA